MLPYPPPNFYQVQLTVLALFCFAAIALERFVDYKKKANGGGEQLSADERRPLVAEPAKNVFAALRRNYLLVYAVVMSEYYYFRGC